MVHDIQLRAFREEDAASLSRHADNPRVAQYLPETFPTPYTVDAARWWVTKGHKLGNVCNRAITLGGECVGAIGATFFEGEYRYTAKLGFWLGESLWGKGIMTRAVSGFSSHLFTEYELRRLYAPVVHSNYASIAVLRKAGFVREGVLRDNVTLRGTVYDEHIYATYP